ncbi:MAG: hypothetical protein J5993_02380 [Clostridia bacterium]|nr:hypothetical protein [Clostridia bacterium]
MKIAYLGPVGSHSSIALKNMCPNDEGVPYPNFREEVKAVLRGEVDACILPIENTLQGGVLQNLDLLQAYPLIAVEEYTLRIVHKLIYRRGTKLKDIKRIYSHEQAIGQCSDFLLEVVPQAEVIAVESTAKGVSMISSATDAGIGSELLVTDGLDAYAGEIANEPNNFTHFLLVVPEEEGKFRHSERVFLVAVCPNRPGSLVGLLEIISKAGLDMTKIESRPIKQNPGTYSFFIEFKGDYLSETVQKVVADMRDYCLGLKIIGTY